MKAPKYLYKYKAISSITDLSRVLAIIRDSSIYMPTYDQLNDPLEGAGYNITIPGWAGVSILEAADMELPPVEDMKKQFRILSLSLDPVSPQLWAHYSNNYNGVCLCFSTDGVFREAEKVLYRQKKRKKAFTEKDLVEGVRRGFFYKQKDWSYENEWRIVGRMEDGKEFLHFAPKDLAAVIIGKNTPVDIAQIIIDNLKDHVRVFKAVPGYQTAGIHLLDWNYEIQLDGSPIEYVTRIEDELPK